jgi:hypothetical protein
MGNTLHNKIYLGRHATFGSRRTQLALGLAVGAGIVLTLAIARALR